MKTFLKVIFFIIIFLSFLSLLLPTAIACGVSVKNQKVIIIDAVSKKPINEYFISVDSRQQSFISKKSEFQYIRTGGYSRNVSLLFSRKRVGFATDKIKVFVDGYHDFLLDTPSIHKSWYFGSIQLDPIVIELTKI